MAGVDLPAGKTLTHDQPLRRRWQFVRHAVVLAVGCGILFATWRRVGIQGLILPIRIASGSMAETLVGPHWQVTCNHCHFPFRCGADHPPADNGATCPNCGFAHVPLAQDDLRLADRVLIDRWTYLWHTPARHDIVAVRSPDELRMWAAKRVVGLPGESIAIRDGDLYVDGQVSRKPWPLLFTMAVTIHDDSHRPIDVSADSVRWRPNHANSGWQRDAQGYTYHSAAEPHRTSAAAPAADWDWLVYRHQSGLPPPTIHDGDAPWLDNDPYNQSLSRPLHRIHDVLLSLQVRNPDRHPLAIALTTRGHDLLVAWRPEDRQWELTDANKFDRASTLTSRGQPVAQVRYEWPPGENHVTCHVAYCDGQVLLIVNGHTLISQTVAPTPSTPFRQPCGIRIGACQGSLHVGAIRLARDIYYTPVSSLASKPGAAQVLGPAQYLVLGDNSPASVDGRVWGPVSEEAILGRVVRWQR